MLPSTRRRWLAAVGRLGHVGVLAARAAVRPVLRGRTRRGVPGWPSRPDSRWLVSVRQRRVLAVAARRAERAPAPRRTWWRLVLRRWPSPGRAASVLLVGRGTAPDLAPLDAEAPWPCVRGWPRRRRRRAVAFDASGRAVAPHGLQPPRAQDALASWDRVERGEVRAFLARPRRARRRTSAGSTSDAAFAADGRLLAAGDGRDPRAAIPRPAASEWLRSAVRGDGAAAWPCERATAPVSGCRGAGRSGIAGRAESCSSTSHDGRSADRDRTAHGSCTRVALDAAGEDAGHRRRETAPSASGASTGSEPHLLVRPRRAA